MVLARMDVARMDVARMDVARMDVAGMDVAGRNGESGLHLGLGMQGRKGVGRWRG